MDAALMYLMLRNGRQNPLNMLPFLYLNEIRNRNRLLILAYSLMQELGSDDEDDRSDKSDEDDDNMSDDDENSEGGCWYPEPDDTYERYSWRDEDDYQLPSDQENSSDNQSEDEQEPESEDNQNDSPYDNILNPPQTNYMIRSTNSSSATASNVPDTPTPFLNLHGPNIPSLTDIPHRKSPIKRKNCGLGFDENTVIDTPSSFVKANPQNQSSKSPLSGQNNLDLTTVPTTSSSAAKSNSSLSKSAREQSSSSSNSRKRRVSTSEKKSDAVKPAESSNIAPTAKRPKLMREARRKSQYGK